MCSIAGIISLEPISTMPVLLEKMNQAQQHRGRDGEGIYIYEHNGVHGGLAHRRLAILDRSENAAQPFHYLNRYVLVYNGEIYNFKEIRATLISKGYPFRSSSDTEVIAAAYDAYGENCLQYFDGMFAFALWDQQQHRLFCARDRFGEKPFHYHYNSSRQTFYFASEIKGIFAAGIDREPEPTMLYNYLTLGQTRRADKPYQTFYREIFQLPPSHHLIFDPLKQEPVVSRYWDLDKETVHPLGEQDAVDQFSELFQDSVKKRLRSDVSIGSSLSGGLDSSSIVAIASNLGDQTFSHQCFSAIFPGFEKDESDKIRMVASQLRLDLHTVSPSADEFCSLLQDVVAAQDEPIGSATVLAQYAVYAKAKEQGVMVLLDGQGADEVLGGYTKYTHWFLQEMIAKQGWSQANRAAAAFSDNGLLPSWNWKNRVAAMMPYITAKQLEKKAAGIQRSNPFINKEFSKSAADTRSIYKPIVEKLNDIQYADLMVQGLEELLRYADRNSMAHGREVRLPFLSHELVQFIISLPSKFRMNNGFSKWILRSAMDKRLPAEILWQKGKVGFEPPQQVWMQQACSQQVIKEQRQKLVDFRICGSSLLEQPIQPKGAHERDNFDFRCLAAGLWL